MNLFSSSIILAISFCFFSSCNTNKNNNTENDETTINLKDDFSEDESRTYVYPKNIFSESEKIEFYLIGFNSTGQIAYIDRPFSDGHNIIIQDLTTDKKVATLDLIGYRNDETEDPKKDWIRNKDKIANFLRSYGIVQKKLHPNKSNLINYKNNMYKITSNQYTVDDATANTMTKLVYSASVLLNNVKRKTVTSGQQVDGESFEYLGYLKSPFSNQLGLLFNKKYSVLCNEVNEIVVVGCIMDPEYF
jgi:hypothetical protein